MAALLVRVELKIERLFATPMSDALAAGRFAAANAGIIAHRRRFALFVEPMVLPVQAPEAVISTPSLNNLD